MHVHTLGNYDSDLMYPVLSTEKRLKPKVRNRSIKRFWFARKKTSP